MKTNKHNFLQNTHSLDFVLINLGLWFILNFYDVNIFILSIFCHHFYAIFYENYAFGDMSDCLLMWLEINVIFAL